ncbi:MAG TPA: hypothetical protein VN048_00210 [Verrucomicrobiae bacterium]|jgi:hypothetical protein|nr:hypothetical protein [Verrucomicrobiae bacterium]
MNEKLEALRRRIEHEDNLVNQRLSWLVASQAFMLTAFAISLNAPLNSLTPAYAAANRTMVLLLPYLSVACILILWLTLAGAIWSMKLLRGQAAAIALPNDIPVQSPPAIRSLGLAAPIGIPIVFLLLWLALIMAGNGGAHPVS